MEVGVEILSDFEFSMLEEYVSSVENKYQHGASSSDRGSTNNSEPKTGTQVYNKLQNNTQTHQNQTTNNFGGSWMHPSTLNHSNTGHNNSTQPQIVHSNTFQLSNNKMLPSVNPSQQAHSVHHNTANYNSTPYNNSTNYNNSTPYNNSTHFNNSTNYNNSPYKSTQQQQSQPNNLQMLKESLSRGNQTPRANVSTLQKQQLTAQTTASPSKSFPSSTPFPSSSTPFTPSPASSTSTAASTSNTVSNKLPLRVELQLVAKDRFGTSHTTDERVNGIFRAVPGAEFVQEEKRWSFPVQQYNALCTALQQLSYVTLVKLPAAILQTFLHSTALTDSAVKLEKIPAPLLDVLKPFQRAGVIFAVKRNGRCLIGDEMGLGKTLQAIAICCYYRDEWPALIIVPSSVKLQWSEHIEKWVPELKEGDINIVMNAKCPCDRNINIISYELVVKMAAVIQQQHFRVVIADESHMLKGFSTKRTKTIQPIIKSAKRAVLLTGTPALSRPSELFPQLHALEPQLFARFHEYGVRYCAGFGGRFGWDYSGASNLTELHLLLENTVMIRRRKKDVLHELPSKSRRQVFIKIDEKHTKILGLVNTELHKFQRQLFKVAKKEQYKQIRSETHSLIMELYKDTGRAKLPSVIEYIKDLLDSMDFKFLVFAHHKDVVDGICSALQNQKVQYIRIDGKTPPQQRHELVQFFQSDEKCRVAVLSILAAGVGLNLTAANTVIFAELFWNPGALKQAEDRVHRIGQESLVDIRYLIAKDTLDEHLWSILERKLSVLGEALNGEGENIGASHTEEVTLPDVDRSVMDEFLERVLQKVDLLSERTEDRRQRFARKKSRLNSNNEAAVNVDSDSDIDDDTLKHKSSSNSAVTQPIKQKPIYVDDSMEDFEVDTSADSDTVMQVQQPSLQQKEQAKEQASAKLKKFVFTKSKPS